MELVKKNLLSILCGVVALIAVAAVLWPISGTMFGGLRTDLAKHKADFDKLQGLATQQRHLPLPATASGAEGDASAAPVLGAFPSQAVIDAGKQAVADVKTQADKMRDEVIHLNRHEALLPAPFTPAHAGDQAYPFKRRYNQVLDEDIPKLLDRATPPDEREIALRETQLHADLEKNMLIKSDDKGEMNRDQVEQAFEQERQNLPEVMKREASTQHKMYMDREALSRHPSLAPDAERQPTDTDVWYAQLSLWVEADIAGALAELNKNSKQVATSPVKQLVSLEIPPDAEMYVADPPLMMESAGTGAAGAASSGDAAAPAADPSAAPPKMPSVSPTGRVCNGLYDVIRFTLVLNVDATKIPKVLAELQRNKLITFWTADIASVDSNAEQLNGYVFGPAPVVKLTLHGEDLFLRDWTLPMMPPSIKTLLKAAPADAAPADKTVAANQ